MSYSSERDAIARYPSVIVTIYSDKCTRTFGSSPCLATGAPCFNTLATCKYRAAYVAAQTSQRFCEVSTPTPLPGEIIRPYLDEVRRLPQELLPADASLVNQRMTLTFRDEEDADIGVDPYRVSATLRSAPGGTETITAQGTYWRKFLARNKHYKGRRVTVQRGFVSGGFALADYQTEFTGVMESIDIQADGRVKVSIVGLLAMTDVDYPQKTDGRLADDITAGQVSFSLAAWSGVDMYALAPASKYDASGHLKIDTEILSYSGRSLDTATGVTTFTGVTRGLYVDDGWAAAAHASDAMVQQVKIHQGNPIDIMSTLLQTAGISSSDIDTAGFNAERDTWYPGITVRGLLHEPGRVKTYLRELREITAASIYQGDDQKIHIAAIHPAAPGQSYTEITDAAAIIHGSRSVDDQQEQRITRAVIYYDPLPNVSGTEPEHFSRAVAVIDAGAESAVEYAEVKNRAPILSRWVRSFVTGHDYPRLIATRLVKRFRDGMRTITLEVDLKDEALQVGAVFAVSTALLVNASGRTARQYYQVTKREPSRGRIRITAIDAKLGDRYCWISPAGHPDYASASESQREYGYICDDATNAMPNGDPPYSIV